MSHLQLGDGLDSLPVCHSGVLGHNLGSQLALSDAAVVALPWAKRLGRVDEAVGDDKGDAGRQGDGGGLEGRKLDDLGLAGLAEARDGLVHATAHGAAVALCQNGSLSNLCARELREREGERRGSKCIIKWTLVYLSQTLKRGGGGVGAVP